MPQLDFSTYLTQIIWLILVFPLLYIYIAKFFSVTMEKIISDRNNKIRENIAEAEVMLEKHKKLKVEIGTILANARSIALSIKEEVSSEAKSLMDAEFEKFEADLAYRAEEEEKRIQILKLQLKSQLPSMAKHLGAKIFSVISKEFNNNTHQIH